MVITCTLENGLAVRNISSVLKSHVISFCETTKLYSTLSNKRQFYIGLRWSNFILFSNSPTNFGCVTVRKCLNTKAYGKIYDNESLVDNLN